LLDILAFTGMSLLIIRCFQVKISVITLQLTPLEIQLKLDPLPLCIRMGHKKGANVFLSVTLSKNKRILMQFSLLDLAMNGTCGRMNTTHLTELMLLHYLVKVRTPKM